ncbi:hypothetical protein M406DRAFT_327098 [Cryphonectria parasitica EP155]|uniref:Nitrogen regulatory protein areA GATA-like domain-containing protein n=1 Tax=Cryphonectria parasitica (strain ATCC 38755 / EP155) TaxID=660469 RepID=A0A9P5CRW6_CRYP1|nr:uncharacterized protein M406DRAFT_327098 [Cryphonectria parasitica EP155]KAF3768678.1 hypothetical protein M406DRAFT_327098 [Cryphonectria parasitica EP155]
MAAEEIAEVLAMLLPPGLLFDSPQIYVEVAKLPVVPLEDVRRHWYAYTSMYKKLQDPTACRLENFWWHVWGSDRRHLSGKTLARLWEQIASGPTAVPLRGPPVPPPPLSRPPIPHAQSMHESDRSEQPLDGDPRNTRSKAQAAQTSMPLPQSLAPSSSRPPPSHPILKKPRGPSNSGPRPTARFVDVPDSEEDETTQQSSGSPQNGNGASQSDSTGKNRVPARSAPRTRSPSKTERKSAAGKKFVASSNALKRRPVLPRRQSSQSSTGSAGSDTTVKDGDSPTPRQSHLHQSSVVAASKEDSFSGRQAVSGLTSPAEVPQLSAKQLGKLPAVETEPTNQTTAKGPQQSGLRTVMNAKPPKRTSSPLSQGEKTKASTEASRECAKSTIEKPAADTTVLSNSPPVPSNKSLGSLDGATGRKTPQRTGLGRNHESTKEKAEETRVAGNVPRRPSSVHATGAAPAMVRLKSNEPKRMSPGPVSAGSFKSPSVVGMSKLAVKGGFDFETPRARPFDEDLPPLGADEPDIRKTSVLDSRFTPTQPNPAPAPPMGRSKSQLTLLLERDKSRSGDRPRNGSASSQHDDGKDNGKRQG